jgi:hypothetical protein
MLAMLEIKFTVEVLLMADSYFLLYEKSELSLSKFGETLFIVFTLE